MTGPRPHNLLTPADVAEILQVIQENIIQPRWLKLTQAAKYSNIGMGRLKKLANSGKIKGYPDADSGRGDWIFDKNSIDKYRLAPFNEIESELKEILDRMKGKA